MASHVSTINSQKVEIQIQNIVVYLLTESKDSQETKIILKRNTIALQFLQYFVNKYIHQCRFTLDETE